jgi:hypothetical protein
MQSSDGARAQNRGPNGRFAAEAVQQATAQRKPGAEALIAALRPPAAPPLAPEGGHQTPNVQAAPDRQPQADVTLAPPWSLHRQRAKVELDPLAEHRRRLSQ